MRETKVRIDPFGFVGLEDIRIDQKVNEHARAVVYGLLDSEHIDGYREMLLDDDLWVKIRIFGEDTKGDLFCGIVKAYELHSKASLHYLKLELVSGTYQMDQKQHIRVFQEEQKNYEKMYEVITKEYFQNGIVFGERAKSTVKDLVVQYKETDWEFASRLAASSGEFLIPEVLTMGIRYFTKFPKRGSVVLPETERYKRYKKRLLPGMERATEALCFTSREIHDMGDQVIVGGRPFCIFQIQSHLQQGELLHEYHLVPEGECFCNKRFAERMAGVSMLGTVKKVKRDTVFIELLEDEYKTSSYRWFPFLTVYSSQDGTGWYCMPEEGDQVRLLFPDADEKNAYVISAVHLPTENGRSNPDEKSFKNKYNKEIRFTPEKLLITNNAGSFIEISDDHGIWIESDKDIHIRAKGQMAVVSEEQDVTLSAENVLRLRQKETSIKLSEDIILSGGEFRLQ